MRGQPIFLQGLRPTLHISHRGGALLAPENTLDAFRQAVERFHTDMLELDVHVTRDGEVVVAHDATLERCTNARGALDALTLPELQRLDAGYGFTPDEGRTFPFRGRGVRIPTLREVLRAFPSLRLNVELKPDVEGQEDVLARLLETEQAVDRVCVGSEQDAVGERLARRLPRACHFYPRDALAAFVIALRAGEPPPEDDRFQVLDMPLYFGEVRLVDADFLRACAARDKWVNVWTVDDPAEMDQLLAEGVGGVMTDRPDLLRQRMDALAKPG
ncbi:glycerophosphodiester phosphodiesterase [Myxococcus sp. K15C18031901]|uniref:glycerophosphodiester phosphodiesterase n=1 Tax=Myxococcus dinghuensis TaxID=2906761 RepID=UPI0020A75C60|nr:glycerophosphodiester phosphodiesterase [Myxococcus dinghuensis]MCP3097768.1 glycerophosphodiester phosphodiesterase [Myxococcus dinghuensis]